MFNFPKYLVSRLPHWFKSQEKHQILASLRRPRRAGEQTPKRSARDWILSLVWLCLIGWLAFFWKLGNIGLIDETEPLFAEASRQMTVTGDWITPYFNGETRFDKPPLIYWCQAIAYQIVGVNEWGVRLPSAIAAIALVCFGFYLLHKYGHYSLSDRASKIVEKFPTTRFLLPWMGAAIMALNLQTIAWGRIGVSDMLLTSCMCSALLAFFIGYVSQEKTSISIFSQTETVFSPPPTKRLEAKTKKHLAQNQSKSQSSTSNSQLPTLNKWYLAFYILTALAVLTKGPVGIVLPGLIIGSFVLYVGKIRDIWQEIYPLRGSLIFLSITLPWYILVTLKNGQAYLNSFFGYHNFERFTSVVNHHAGPWYFYFLIVLVGFAPWSIYLPVAMARTQFWKRRYWRHQPRQNHLGLFAIFWFSCIFVFFSVAVTKLPSYVLPLMPAAAILVALLWGDIILSINEEKIVSPSAKGELTSGSASRSAQKKDAIADKFHFDGNLPQPLVAPPAKGEVASGSASRSAQKLERGEKTLGNPSLEKEENFENPLLQSWERREVIVDKFIYVSAIFNIVFLALLAGVILISFQWLDGDPAMPNFPQAIQESGLLIRGSLIFATTAIFIAFLLIKRQISWILTINFIGLTAFLILAIAPTLFLVDTHRQLPLRQLAETIVRVRQPGEELVMIGFEKPSLVFYTKKPVSFFQRATNARKYLEEISQHNFDNIDFPNPEGKSPQESVLIIGYPRKFLHAGLKPDLYQYLNSGGAYMLARVPKQVFLEKKHE